MDIQTKKAIHHLAWMMWQHQGYFPAKELHETWALGAIKANEDLSYFLDDIGLGVTDGNRCFTPSHELINIMNDSSLED